MIGEIKDLARRTSGVGESTGQNIQIEDILRLNPGQVEIRPRSFFVPAIRSGPWIIDPLARLTGDTVEGEL